MKHIALSFMLLAATAVAQAQVTVKDAWVRGTVPQQKASGAFMQLSSDKAVRLVAVKTPVAGVVEIHEMAMADNIMKMRQVPGVDIVPGRVTELKPGGYHVMMMDLTSQLKAGDTVPLTLVFEDVKSRTRFTQEVKAPVTALGGHMSEAPMDGMSHKH